jgi:hypothetical protein
MGDLIFEETWLHRKERENWKARGKLNASTVTHCRWRAAVPAVSVQR